MDDPFGWIMKDVGHSSPVFVGAPVEDEEYAAYSEDGYASFKTTRANRRPTVYVGGNAGGLHAFDASSGEERWMFVPQNLISASVATNRGGIIRAPIFRRWRSDGSRCF